jgi:hypothetical protein
MASERKGAAMMDGKRILTSELKFFSTICAVDSGAIIRHFNIHRSIFMMREGMRKALVGRNMIDNAPIQQEAVRRYY